MIAEFVLADVLSWLPNLWIWPSPGNSSRLSCFCCLLPLVTSFQIVSSFERQNSRKCLWRVVSEGKWIRTWYIWMVDNCRSERFVEVGEGRDERAGFVVTLLAYCEGSGESNNILADLKLKSEYVLNVVSWGWRRCLTVKSSYSRFSKYSWTRTRPFSIIVKASWYWDSAKETTIIDCLIMVRHCKIH